MRIRWTEYIVKREDLTLCDLWHKGDFLKKFTFEDKFAIIQNNSLKKKFSCIVFSAAHILQKYCIELTLICIFIQDWKCKFELLDC